MFETVARSHRRRGTRSEEHTSELQSRLHLVCRLLLEKKKQARNRVNTITNSATTSIYGPLPLLNKAIGKHCGRAKRQTQYCSGGGDRRRSHRERLGQP